MLPALPFLNSHWMNTMYRCALALLTVAVLAAPAQAQVQRNFPADALRGALVVGNPPEALLNGKDARLAPGVRIRGQNNMLAMSGAVIGAKLLVNYTLDNQGLVKDVWILRPEEAAVKPWPTTAEQASTWQFDAGAQTWTKP